MTEIPSIRQAQRDPKLSRLALTALDVLRDQLDVLSWRAVKLAVLEEALRRSRPQAVKVIKELVDLGYLERGERAWSNGPWTYRLYYSRAQPVESEEPEAEAAEEPDSRGAGGFGMMSRGVDW